MKHLTKCMLTAIMAIAAMTALNSCNDESLENAYEEGVSLDVPYLFSEGSGKNAGLGSVLSWLKAWPNLEIRVGYKIF